MIKAPPTQKGTKKKIAIFIDAANFEISLKMCGLRSNFPQMIQFIKRKFSEKLFIRYYKVDYGTKSQARFFSRIKNLGFKIITKKMKIIRQKRKNTRKANFDVEIAFDSAILIKSYDHLVLLSGDSDFVYLAQELQRRDKIVTVISPHFRTARELRKVANAFIDLRECPFVYKYKIELKKLPLSREDHDNLTTAKKIYQKKGGKSSD